MKLANKGNMSILGMLTGMSDWNPGLLQGLHSGMTYPFAKANRGFKRNRRLQMKTSFKRSYS